MTDDDLEPGDPAMRFPLQDFLDFEISRGDGRAEARIPSISHCFWVAPSMLAATSASMTSNPDLSAKLRLPMALLAVTLAVAGLGGPSGTA